MTTYLTRLCPAVLTRNLENFYRQGNCKAHSTCIVDFNRNQHSGWGGCILPVGLSRASCLMCDSLHPFCVHANHLTTTKTDKYGLMVPYTFFSFPRQVQCLPGIFVSRPSLSRFRVGEFTAFPSLERPCRGQALSGCGLGNSSVVPEPFFPSGTPECLAKRIRKFRRAQQSQKYFQDGKKNL